MQMGTQDEQDFVENDFNGWFRLRRVGNSETHCPRATTAGG
jgi:hypothetical protein